MLVSEPRASMLIFETSLEAVPITMEPKPAQAASLHIQVNGEGVRYLDVARAGGSNNGPHGITQSPQLPLLGVGPPGMLMRKRLLCRMRCSGPGAAQVLQRTRAGVTSSPARYRGWARTETRLLPRCWSRVTSGGAAPLRLLKRTRFSG